MDMIQKKNGLIFGIEEGMIRTTKDENIMDNNSFVSITESSSESHSSLLCNALKIPINPCFEFSLQKNILI